MGFEHLSINQTRLHVIINETRYTYRSHRLEQLSCSKFYASPTGCRLLWVVWKTLAVECEVLLLENSSNPHQTRCA
ncbi:hypothetical protein PO909_003784 [Leuciscus waleckii]